MSLPDRKYLGHIYCQFRFEYLHNLLLDSINMYSILIQRLRNNPVLIKCWIYKTWITFLSINAFS